MQYKRETLCWSCQRAVKGCSWSKSFVPIKGWVAEPNILKPVSNKYCEKKIIKSYCVISCPLYLKDEPREIFQEDEEETENEEKRMFMGC